MEAWGFAISFATCYAALLARTED